MKYIQFDRLRRVVMGIRGGIVCEAGYYPNTQLFDLKSFSRCSANLRNLERCLI